MKIAVDGPAASGKGTLARRIATHLGYHYLDTGLLYRAVARDVQTLGFKLTDPWAALVAARGLDTATLHDPQLRSAGCGEAASVVARVPSVRQALLGLQKSFAHRPPGAVLDGRDIGTVVCPDAQVKIFVTASAEVRARRRYLEHHANGDSISYEAVLDLIRTRDARDAERSAAPMRPAADACLLDTTALDIDAAFDAALRLIERKIGHPEQA